jgi:hypothetical protein
MGATDIIREPQNPDPPPSKAEDIPASTSVDPPNGLPQNGDHEPKPAAAVAPNEVPQPAPDAIAGKAGEGSVAVASAATTNDLGDDDDDDGQSVQSEGAEEEDALFANLEKKVEQEEAAHPMEQPSDATSAPKLLQDALKQGEVKMDDSEHGGATAMEEKEKGESKKEEEGVDDHIHHRVSPVFSEHSRAFTGQSRLVGLSSIVRGLSSISIGSQRENPFLRFRLALTLTI